MTMLNKVNIMTQRRKQQVKKVHNLKNEISLEQGKKIGGKMGVRHLS